MLRLYISVYVLCEMFFLVCTKLLCDYVVAFLYSLDTRTPVKGMVFVVSKYIYNMIHNAINYCKYMNISHGVA